MSRVDQLIPSVEASYSNGERTISDWLRKNASGGRGEAQKATSSLSSRRSDVSKANDKAVTRYGTQFWQAKAFSQGQLDEVQMAIRLLQDQVDIFKSLRPPYEATHLKNLADISKTLHKVTLRVINDRLNELGKAATIPSATSSRASSLASVPTSSEEPPLPEGVFVIVTDIPSSGYTVRKTTLKAGTRVVKMSEANYTGRVDIETLESPSRRGDVLPKYIRKSIPCTVPKDYAYLLGAEGDLDRYRIQRRDGENWIVTKKGTDTSERRKRCDFRIWPEEAG